MKTAKVENACAQKRCKEIQVDSGERVCINCIWYEQYFRRGRGNIPMWTPTSAGNCLLHDCRRGALRQPCSDFER